MEAPPCELCGHPKRERRQHGTGATYHTCTRRPCRAARAQARAEAPPAPPRRPRVARTAEGSLGPRPAPPRAAGDGPRPRAPEPVAPKAGPTQRWLTDPAVRVCTVDGCHYDAGTCRHGKT
jgi:hypothetical protein